MIEETVKANLRSDMFRNLLKQDMCFFDDERNSAGSLASRLASDTKLAAGGFGVSLAVQVQAACCGVVSLSMALWYCWQLTLALIGTLPIGIIAEIYADNLQTRAAAKAQDGARDRLKCNSLAERLHSSPVALCSSGGTSNVHRHRGYLGLLDGGDLPDARAGREDVRGGGIRQR